MARRDMVLVSRTLYQLGVLTLVASMMWVGVGIYSAMGENVKTSVDQSVLTPINPALDQEVVVKMTSRLKVVRVESEIIPEVEVVEIIENESLDNDTIEDDGIR